MKIYLAGKIGKDDWRSSILGDDRPGALPNYPDWEALRQDGWPVAYKAIDEHDYVGPWFISCDHGCAHGPSTHGANYDDACAGRSVIEGQRATDVASLCRRAIASADVVFAWVDSLDAFGTLVEIGYAVASGVPVIVGHPSHFDSSDLWFVHQLALQVVVVSDVPGPAFSVALSYFLDLDHKAKAEARCESPIERRLLDAFIAAGFTERLNDGFVLLAPNRWIVLTQQQPIGHYRLDFALTAFDVTVPPPQPPTLYLAIEVDGRDFHERTKEQAQRDKARDRFLVAEGWQVLRFTGSEVHRDARACVAETLRVVERLAVPAAPTGPGGGA